MALAILDGTQTATTLSTILSSGQHITAHTVVSLGTQAKTDILSAVSSGIAISGTVTVGNSVTIGSLPAISGTVTANVLGKDANSTATPQIPVIAYDEAIESAGSPYVVPVQLSNVGGQISTVNPLPISGTVTANTFALQGTAVTTSNFTSTTASTVLAGFNATREVLTIFSEGPGTLFVSAGATCTTVQYQVRLSSGDYYEAPSHQSTITHSAVFATAGTARIVQIS